MHANPVHRMTRTALAAGALLLATPVLAHPGHEVATLISGLAHPVMGLDHLLAMVAVGLLAARQHGRMRWMLPTSFVAAMLAGAGLSALGFGLPAVETGIAVSVLILGLLIASLARLPAAMSLLMVATFALFHGHAHHAEMGDGSMLAFTTGFASATALLHLTGFLIARTIPTTRGGRVLTTAIGGAMAAAGGFMLA